MSELNLWIKTAMIKHQAKLMAYVRRILGDTARAQDVVQESFLRLITQGEPRPHIPGWLYLVCRNLAIDILRKENRFDAIEEEKVLDLQYVAQDEKVMKIEESEHVKALLNALAPKHKEVVILKFHNELSYKEIADITGLSVSNIGFIIHSAVKKMRQAIDKGNNL